MILKDEKGEVKSDDTTEEPVAKEVALTDIMDNTYKDYEIYSPPLPSLPNLKPEKIGTLNGDMSPTQVKRFFDKYDLLDFYPKFDTKNNKQKKGFHACLFQDKESKEYTLAIRGSFDERDYITDFLISLEILLSLLNESIYRLRWRALHFFEFIYQFFIFHSFILHFIICHYLSFLVGYNDAIQPLDKFIFCDIFSDFIE